MTPQMKPTPEQRRRAGVMLMVEAWIDMIVVPVMGYFIVPMVMQ